MMMGLFFFNKNNEKTLKYFGRLIKMITQWLKISEKSHEKLSKENEIFWGFFKHCDFKMSFVWRSN